MNQTIKTHFSFRCVALFCFLFFMQQASAQNSYIYADKTILAGRGIGNNEFELHNGTRGVLGALVNVGGGVTQFKLVVDTAFALNDSTTRYHRTNGSTFDITIHSSGSGGGITTETDPIWNSEKTNYYTKTESDARYLQSFTESDPVATAKTITITGSSDVPVTGGTQTIGANPSFTIGSVNWANGFSVYDARYLTASTQNEVISGGKVTWLHDYVYNVSAATYLIDGVNHSSPSTDITLSTADATDDRIDVFVLTTSNTAIAITGTPSTPAVEPAIDANTQLQISFADVNAGSTSPTLNVDWIYQENTEWPTATSSPGTVNLSSTNTPYAGSKDIEGTSVANNTTISFTSATTPTMGNYQSLVFEIKSKANWSTTKKWVLRFFNGTTAIGNPVNFGSSSYGFVSTSTSQYQTITIPLSDFGSISTATKFIITQSNSSGTIGWFLDNVQLQGGGGGGTPSTVALVNDVTGTGTNTIPTTVVAIRNKNIPTLAAGNLKFNGSIWVFDNSTYLTGNQSITISGDATGTGTTSIPLTLATVNSSPGTYGSASQSLTGTVNGKGLITSLSAQNIQIAESQVTNLTTDLSGKQASLTGSQGDMIYFSATNALASLAKSTTAHQFISSDGTSNNPLYETINSDWITQGSTNKFYTDALARAAISLTTTGTSGASTYNSSTGVLNIPQYSAGGGGSFWPLSGTGTLTGPTTIQSNAANNHVFNGTWTTTANNQYHLDASPSITTRNSIGDTANAILIDPVLTSGNTSGTQWLTALNINPTFSFSAGNNIPIGLKVSKGMIAIDSISATDRTAALSVALNNSFVSTNYNTNVVFRSKRNPSAFLKLYDNSNEAGGSTALVLDYTNSSGTSLFHLTGSAASYAFGGGNISIGSTINNTSSSSIWGPNYMLFSSGFMFAKGTTTGSAFKFFELTSNEHVLIGGPSTDGSYRLQVNGDSKIVSSLRVDSMATPSISAAIGGTAGSTTITYKAVARTPDGRTTDAGTVTVNTANATLSSSNFVQISITDVVASAPAARTGSAAFYDIYRTSTAGSPATTGKIGTINVSNVFTSPSFNDTGLTGDGTSVPTGNNTGSMTARYYKYISYTSAQVSTLTGMQAGDSIYCSDCTANDASTGVVEVYNGSTFKKLW